MARYVPLTSGPWEADDAGQSLPVLADGQTFNNYFNTEHGPTVDGLASEVRHRSQSLDGMVNTDGRGLIHSS